MKDPDNIGLVADAAITELGVQAKAIERLACKMPVSAERHELVWIIETMRDAEVRLRQRIATLAHAAARL